MAETGAHPRARYFERYGEPLPEADLRDIERQLGAGGGVLLRRKPDRHVATGCEVRIMQHAGRVIVAVYSTITGKVKTFLPADAPLAAHARRHRIALSRGRDG